jgi:uncharacterized protein (TIGR03086 family)
MMATTSRHEPASPSSGQSGQGDGGQVPLEELETALQATRRVLAAVRPEQWELATPCPAWTVADVSDHLILGNRMFAAALHRDSAPQTSGSERLDGGQVEGDRAEAYDAAADQLLDAFRADGSLQRLVTVPFGTVPGAVALQLRLTELLVHGWDIARATGQTLHAPAAVSEAALVFSQHAVAQLPLDRSPFGQPQPAPSGAGPLEQLVALLGRAI